MAESSRDFPPCPYCGNHLRTVHAETEGDLRCPACSLVFFRLRDEDGKPIALREHDLEPVPEPLGLPKGSVRALVALGLAFTALVLILLPNRQVPEYLFDLLLTVIAYYFASRAGGKAVRGIHPTTAAARQAPLNLPAHSVRILLVVAVLVAGGAVVAQGNILQPTYLGFFVVLAGLIVGMLWRLVRGPGRPGPFALFVNNVLALTVLVATGALVTMFLTGLYDRMTAVGITVGSLVTFYFGTRG